MAERISRLDALHYVHEGLCVLHGVVTFLYRFGRLELSVPVLGRIEVISTQIGLLIYEIESGTVEDFPP
jgi:hypothetical protein